MKHAILASLCTLILTGASYAEPVVPWAQPEKFPQQQDQNEEKPLFERVMEEERRRKEQGNKATVTAEDLKANAHQTKPVAPPAATPGSSDPTKEPSNQAPTENPTAREFKALERGAEGKEVEAVQKTLIALGFGLPAGADGDYGGQTELAVMGFQSSVSLPQTGKLDKATYEALVKVRPAEGKNVWEDRTAAVQSVPEVPTVSGKKARVLIDLSEHRLCVYDATGVVQRVFPVASGAKKTPTDTGVKVVNAKLDDPTELAEKLWPESKGTAFGKRLIDLNWYNVETGSQTVSDEELHGTYELESIGKYASHGCVRLTNESIEWLYQNLVLGDIVVIRD